MKQKKNNFISVKENSSKTLQPKAQDKAADQDSPQKINFNIGKYNAVVPQGKQQFAELDLARERAKNIKWRAIETLDQQLETFEAAITKRGAKVIWAEDAEEALDDIKNM